MKRQSTHDAFGTYVHIPYCLKKCDYCDFFSVPSEANAIPHREYLAAIMRQLNREISVRQFGDRIISTVYFGGGTPSLMPASFFGELLCELGERFHIDPGAEISCEANPATMTREWLSEACEAGITRLSIGVQSFNRGLLQSLGRIHSPDDAMRAYACAQDAGFESIGIDLMYAIPGETGAILENDLRTTMALGPDHISAYQLTIEEGTPLAKKTRAWAPERLGACDDEMQLKQMRIVRRMFERAGWGRYEISNFAKPGFECRHNLNYWRYGEYLGLGAGATSCLRACVPACPREDRIQGPRRSGAQGQMFGRRWTQVRDITKYMDANSGLEESEEIDRRTAMAEFCFLGLRTADGISSQRFEETFGVAIESIFGSILSELAANSFVESSGGFTRLTDRGIEISNTISAMFI